MARDPLKGVVFRRKEDGELWVVVGTTFRFNSGMGGASLHLRRINDTSNGIRQTTILWVNSAYGHPEFELANGLERAVGKASKIKQHEK